MARVVPSDGVYRKVLTKESGNKALMEVAKLTELELNRIAFALIAATRHMKPERLSWVPEHLKSYYLTAYNDGVMDFLSVLHTLLAAEEGDETKIL